MDVKEATKQSSSSVRTPGSGEVVSLNDISISDDLLENRETEELTPEAKAAIAATIENGPLQGPGNDVDFPAPKQTKHTPPAHPDSVIVDPISIIRGGREGANVSLGEVKSDISTIYILRRIPKTGFRLGLERLPGNVQLMPGVIHKFEPFMKGKKYLTGLEDKPERRKQLENILGVSLSNDISNEFYRDLSFSMYDREHGQILNLDDTERGAYEEVVYHAMIASPLVSNGLTEYKSGKKSQAEWYIENKEHEAKAEADLMELDLQAFKTLSDMVPSRVVEIARILHTPDAFNGSSTLLKTQIHKGLKSGILLDKNKFSAKDFLELFNKVTSWNPERIAATAIVETAVFLHVIRITGSGDYMYGDEHLGTSNKDVVERLMLPRNKGVLKGIDDKNKAIELRR